MSSSTPQEEEEVSTLPDAIKDDELSRRYYLAGFAGLPWLWIVHNLHWYGKQKKGVGARLLINPDDPDQVAQDQMDQNERKWVRRSRRSAILASIAFLAWVLIVQVFLTDTLPSSWFIRDGDSYQATGW